ncbi:MAG: patatin-like phospholipase family protein [Bacteroidota bacterium]
MHVLLKFRILLILILFSTSFMLKSQSVALVLSGGAAKAYAHIGVIKALEENNIQIDYIVGSSMGALIGALYSSGYTIDEIRELLSNPEFLNITKGSNKGSGCFYQQNEPNASFVTFPFNIDKGFNIHLPLNVYDFQKIDYALMEYFSSASAHSGNNFDSLMIPFRCVAADIDSSRLVIFDHGNLAKTIRASMTFPFMVRPVKIDGVVLFDGGMYDNFPVSVAIKEFNPDFVIGSKAVDNFSSPNPDDPVSLMQSMLMSKANFGIDSLVGLVIETKSGEESIFQFSRINDYIDSGYVAALQMMPQLIARIDTSSSHISISEKRDKYNESLTKTTIGSISVSGLSKRETRYFTKLIGKSNDYGDSESFNEFYDRLLSNENVTNVYPEIIFDTINSSFNLNLIIKKSEPYYLQVGGYISSLGVNEGFVEFGYKYLGSLAKSFSISSYFGTFYNSIAGMGKIEFAGKLPIYLKVNLLVSRKNYFSNARYFYEDKFPAYIISDENYVELSTGIPVGKYTSASVGISNINAYFQYYKDNQFTRTDTADASNFYFLSPAFEFDYNSLDRKQYASKGSQLYFGGGYYFGNEKYTAGSGKSPADEVTKDLGYYTLSLRYLNYFQLSNTLSLGLSTQFSISSKPLLDSYISSLLLATPYEPIPVMKTLFLENYRANNFGSVGASLVYEFYGRFDFRLDGYYYVPYQKILKNSTDNTAYLSPAFFYHYSLGSAQLTFRPPVGIITVSVNYIDKPGNKVGFLINIGYLIFNKSKLNR